MRDHWLIGCIFCVFCLAACSADADLSRGGDPLGRFDEGPMEGGKADIGAPSCHEQNDVCDPTCGQPDPDCYLLFESRAEAIAWYTDAAPLFEVIRGAPAGPAVDASDPRYEIVEGYLERTWEAYQAQAGIRTLPTPRVVLIDSEERNAWVALDPRVEKVALSVMVHTSVIDMDDESAFVGLIVHELAHAVELHPYPGVGERLRKYYWAEEDWEPLGFTMEDDPTARAVAEPWLEAAGAVGPHPRDEFNGLPGLSSAGMKILRWLARSHADPENPACLTASQALGEWYELVLSGYSELDRSISLDEETWRALDERSAAAVMAFSECLSHVQMTLDELATAFAMAIGAPPARLLEAVTDEQRRIFAGGENAFDGLRLLTLDGYARMQEIEAEHDLDRLRYYSTEEAADDRAVLVLLDAGLDPAGFARFLASISSEAHNRSCQDILDRGDVPPYGEDLADTHHATCWRIHHIHQLADHFQHVQAR